MYISDIALDDYRSFHHCVVHLSPGVNILVGPNGQGKTNFVEAIGYLTNFHSHRSSADSALVRFAPQSAALAAREGTALAGSETEGEQADSSSESTAPGAAVIRVKAHSQDHEMQVDLEIGSGRANRARLARSPVPLKQVRGLIATTLFAPEDLDILQGDPAARRRFLDDLLVQLWPVEAGTISQHQKILRQRGALLKQAAKKKRRGADLSLELSTLDVWNNQLAQVGARLIAGRVRALQALTPHAVQAYLLVLGEEHLANSSQTLGLSYVPSFAAPADLADPQAVEAALRETFAARREEELIRGVNLAGAHRDDLAVMLDALPVKGFASHGETWSAALALRLGQFELLRQVGETPILILDDVFAELDPSRRSALLDFMNRADQVLITATSRKDLPPEIEAHFFEVLRAAQGTTVTPMTVSGEVSGEALREDNRQDPS
ncbi:DNA replication/repair protein RecF [Varibaculum prostatecancerukia]|uniref:DNA replication/repair protein RecF n=1 Tax=Varibaculum prostatecancerukia TaxID=2811781 RepID=UPI001C00824C|nr:DNA replication/repair protein RecF [Varibaculum prostatecancerukia]